MHKNIQEISIYYGNKEKRAKNILFGCVIRSEHRIDILNAKSIGKYYVNVFIIEGFIEKTVSLGDSGWPTTCHIKGHGFSKDVQKEPPEVFYSRSCS